MTRIVFTTRGGNTHEIDVDYDAQHRSLMQWFAYATNELAVQTLTGKVVAGRHIIDAWEVPPEQIEPNVVPILERRIAELEEQCGEHQIERLAELPHVLAVEVERYRENAPWLVRIRRDRPVHITTGIGSTLGAAAMDALRVLNPDFDEDGA